MPKQTLLPFKNIPKKDTRTLCKYGASCYQKNPDHHKKYRHPEAEPAKPKKDAKAKPTQVENLSSESEEDVPKAKRPKLSASPRKEPDSSTSEENKGSPVNEDKVASEDEEFRELEPLPPSPKDRKENIKEKCLFDMPEDFYLFWNFCKSINSNSPKDALVKSLGLQLVGPFDILDGSLKNDCVRKKDDILCHWRFYYDPPEFQTVIRRKDDESQYHLGYFRDDPTEGAVFVASNCASKSCNIKAVGENLFAAVYFEIKSKLKETKAGSDHKKQLESLLKKVEEFSKNKNLSLEPVTDDMKKRNRKSQSRTFHGAGLVVPVQNDVGYRPLTETDTNLKKILSKIVSSKNQEEKNKNFSPLQQIMTYVQFANDECDYGMGLELGLDLFCFGDAYFHSMILVLLPLAYELLGRNEFAQIIRAHLKNRRKGSELSCIKK